MHKIYFDNKPLFITNQITKELEEYLHHEDTVFIDEFNIHTVKAMLHEIEQPRVLRGVFLHTDVEAVLNAFKKKLSLVLAAGGLVHTPENDFLLIFRKGKWDLPKGKLDAHEDLETCAVREIKEETGLESVQLEQPLCVTYHTYHEAGKHILKESHWYWLKSEKQPFFLPQTEEDIEKCEWVPTDKLAPYMDATYPSIIDVVEAGIQHLHATKNV